jgi:alkaline phosphatase
MISNNLGFFIMIEASRIDHAGHSNDPIGHIHDTLQYNELMGFVRKWIKDHSDTQMLSAADHECGGLTLYGYNPLIFKVANASTEALSSKFSAYTGSDPAGFLKSAIFPSYGLLNPTDAEIATLVALKGKSTFQNEMGKMLSSRAGVNWSTGGHTATDITLFGYGKGNDGKKLKEEMVGNWDNTELPLYIEKSLKLKMRDATVALRKNGVDWIGKRDAVVKRSEGCQDHH